MKRLLKYIPVLLMLLSCSGKEVLDTGNLKTVYFVFDPVAGKSLTVNESYISNCNIMVYSSEGDLVEGCYNSSGLVTSVSFAARADLTYRFYCVCNIGDITGDSSFRTESGLSNYQYSVSDYSNIIDSNGAVPMTGRSNFISVTDGMNVTIDLTRCVALVTIRIEDRGLHYASLRIDSISLMNVPKKVSLFNTSHPENASERSIWGDSADYGEIVALNNGGTVGFYTFENCQGVLLPKNTTCEGKVLSEGSPYRDLCSYIELSGYYDDTDSYTPRYGNFIYRFYLGEDTTSDFSLVRNHHYDITVDLSDDGVDEVSWRVDEELTPYATAVIVTPSSHTFYGLAGSRTFTATVLPSPADQDVTWSSSNNAVATVNANGVVTPTGFGNAVITATAADGSGMSGHSYITVRNNTAVPVSLDPNYLYEDEWILVKESSVDDFEVTVYYSDGSSRVLTGSDALKLVDTAHSDFTVTDGKLTALELDMDYELDPAVLRLVYTEGGTQVIFESLGGIFDNDDLFYISANANTIPGEVAANITKATALGGIPIVQSDIAITCPSIYLFPGGNQIFASEGHPYNGPLTYTVTGTYHDCFGTVATKSVHCNTTIHEWRQHWYRVVINTKVRTHIDTSYGSQEQPDNIIVSCFFESTVSSPNMIARFFYPASYNENGDLVGSTFTYTWYNRTVTVQMQDEREYYFNCDNNGNYLQEGYCYENGRYIYYEPL